MTIAFKYTQDAEIVRDILTHPKCYSRMVNDTAPPREALTVAEDPRRLAVVATEDGVIAGLFLLVLEAKHVAQVHFCLLPFVWGRSVEVGRAFVAWVWTASSLNVLIGSVPQYNVLALKLAKACGFEESGRAVGGFKRGIPFDLVVTRLERQR